MNTKVIDAVNDLVSSLLAVKNEFYEKLRVSIAQEQANADEAEAKMEEALSKMDIDSYMKFQSAHNNAIMKRDLLQKNADSPRSFISKDEYEKAVADIISAVDQYDLEAREAIAPMARDMYIKGAELIGTRKYACDVLRSLRDDVYMNAGHDIRTAENMLNPSAAADWAMQAAKHYQYSQTTGRRISDEVPVQSGKSSLFDL